MEHQRLLQDLHHKLNDLEHKVRAYRQDLALEFQAYSQHVLSDVAPSTALAIQESLASSLMDYPALAPELQVSFSQRGANAADAHTVPQSAQGQHAHQHRALAESQLASSPSQAPPGEFDRPSPPPPDAAFGDAATASGLPREREREFQGLFTPFFLPLLDDSPQLSSSTTPLPLPTNTLLAQPAIDGTSIGSDRALHVAPAEQLFDSSQQLRGRDMEESGQGPNEVEPTQSASPAPLQSPSRPVSTRRSTDDTTTSSILSDKGSAKAPRSALRRSSSASKPPQPSPRRVRFEVKGAEVLPTSSPSDVATPRQGSPAGPDQPRTFDEIVGDVAAEPPPRKISSSDALRALSRTPLDDPTVWTVVNPGSEDPDLAESPSEELSRATNPADQGTTPTETYSAAAPVSAPVSTQQAANPASIVDTVQQDDEDDDSSEEEEFLSMAKPRSFESKSSITSSLPSRSRDQKPQPSMPARNSVADKAGAGEKDQTSLEEFDEDDDVFHFETGGLSAPPEPKRRPAPLTEDDVDMSETTTAAASLDPSPHQPSSPAVPISRPSAQSGSPTPPTSQYEGRSMGSYRGRPLFMPVVKNPELHAQAASLGEFNTFVGGLDGRSGVDEGDLNSFRASFVQTSLSGTPRSLTERMWMEDAQAEREKNGGWKG